MVSTSMINTIAVHIEANDQDGMIALNKLHDMFVREPSNIVTDCNNGFVATDLVTGRLYVVELNQ